MNDTESEQKTTDFTDASYISRDDAPNMPRSFSCSGKKDDFGSGLWTVAGVCIAVFVVGSFLNAMLISATAQGKARAASAGTASGTDVVAADTVSQTDFAASVAKRADKAPAASGTETAGRPYLGMVVQTVSSAAAEYYNSAGENCMVPGVQVYDVDPDGPACEAGLECGDIITKFDEEPIETAADLTAAEENRAPGESGVMTVFREGEYHEVEVVFSEYPDAESDTAEEPEAYDRENSW